MPKFLIEAMYTPQGVQGLQREGASARRDVLGQLAESLGGRLESFHFAFGERDVYLILDLPDNETAAALAMTVNASGAVKAKTVVLLTPEQVDAATQRTVNYRAPGA